MRKEEMGEEHRAALEKLGVQRGAVMEISEMKEFGAFLGRDESVLGWWRAGMGFVREGD